MIVDNVRVVNKDRLPPAVQPHGTMQHSGESYYLMLSKRDQDPCLIVDVTIQYGDKDPLCSERFIKEYLDKNFPDTTYHFERSIAAFNQMLNDLNKRDENALVQKNEGKSFVYYFIFSEDRDAMEKTARYIGNKTFQNRVQKAAAGE